MSFLFVDAIEEVVPGERARGAFRVPDAGPALSPSLAAEAVGQLAAYVAMAAFDFRRRPVAGIAGEVRAHGDPPRGAWLDLECAVQRIDESVVAYHGAASVDGRPLLELRDCLGPMLDAAELDDPGEVRRRFAALCAAERAGAGVLGAGPEAARLEPAGGEPGRTKQARLAIPSAAPFFADHFPRRAVYPGTLLLEAESRLAGELAAEALGVAPGTLVPRRASGVKLRAFLHPGDAVEISAAVAASDARQVKVRVEAAREGRRVAAARIEVERAPGER